MSSEITEAGQNVSNSIGEKLEWVGWRIASELAETDNGSYFNEIKQELSNINLTLQNINATLTKLAEKE